MSFPQGAGLVAVFSFLLISHYPPYSLLTAYNLSGTVEVEEEYYDSRYLDELLWLATDIQLLYK